MILCAGEALIDMLPRATPEGPAFLPVAGGAVLNTAVALGRLGVPTAFHSGVSTDLFGQRLIDALGESGVEDRTHRSDRPTTLAFVTLTDGQAEYAFYDEGTAGRMLTEADAPDMSGVEALFLGGISLAVEPAARAYEALGLGHAHLPLMLDPNVRPGFVADAAAYRARIGRLVAAATVVKVSDDDLRWLATTPGAMIEAGARVVCVTEGARGVATVTGDGEFRVPARAVEVVDTVGAGDTFNAGVMAGLREAGALGRAAPPRDALEAAVALGVAASAVTVSRAGADPPWRRELADGP